MSSRIVPLEQPPIVDDPALQEWLTRTVILINAALADIPDFTPVGALPDKVENGMVRYFNGAPSLAPTINTPGPWIYVGGTWVSMI